MIIHSQTSFAAPTLQSESQDSARAQTRHAARAVRCSLGEVINISVGGARIITKAGMRSPVDVEFYALNKSITIRARIAWTRAIGDGFKAEVGLAFPKLTRIDREVLESLSRGHMHRSLI